MQIEMIQEWIEKVRVGLDGAAEGGYGSGGERGYVGMSRGGMRLAVRAVEVLRS